MVPLGIATSAPADSPPAFITRFDATLRNQPAQGRLLIFLLKDNAKVSPRQTPADGPFLDNPQPIYGLDIAHLAPDETCAVSRDAAGFPVPVDQLPEGRYRAQAVLDLNQTNSDWQREPGNLYSEVVSFTKSADEPFTVQLPLTKAVAHDEDAAAPGLEWFETDSKLLTDFRSRRVTLRAGVLFPEHYDAARRYAAVYLVPGFGGDHYVARMVQRMGQMSPYAGELRRHAFIITLDPESENGHTLFADSENNGPCGRALVEELIPALEQKYPLIPEASARIVTGHSSGGWSTVWLALQYPGTFAHAFAGAPDPLDFHAFQKINLYRQPNFYTDEQGNDLPSNERNGVVLMTIRQENLWEEARGPNNSSGQQWDSWQAVFGPRNARGHPAALFDPFTGVIDPKIVEHYRRYDVNHLLTENPDRFAPIFANNIRIIVGGADEWNLNAAVELVRENLANIGHPMNGSTSFGRITIVPDTTHGTVMMSPEYRTMGQQILEVLRQAGHAGP
ncbi:MAG: hypothetical protein JNK58_12805 [Phycisphaerae bacterium]|nr:hypothetical protein [Phycisphaerae bacterium]